jgi:serine/threonine protein kinase
MGKILMAGATQRVPILLKSSDSLDHHHQICFSAVEGVANFSLQKVRINVVLSESLQCYSNAHPVGDWKAGVPIPVDADLRQSEAFLNGEAKDKFLEFMRCMLQWRPEDRMTAKQLAEHPWLRSPSPEEELETS